LLLFLSHVACVCRTVTDAPVPIALRVLYCDLPRAFKPKTTDAAGAAVPAAFVQKSVDRYRWLRGLLGRKAVDTPYLDSQGLFSAALSGNGPVIATHPVLNGGLRTVAEGLRTVSLKLVSCFVKALDYSSAVRTSFDLMREHPRDLGLVSNLGRVYLQVGTWSLVKTAFLRVDLLTRMGQWLKLTSSCLAMWLNHAASGWLHLSRTAYV